MQKNSWSLGYIKSSTILLPKKYLLCKIVSFIHHMITICNINKWCNINSSPHLQPQTFQMTLIESMYPHKLIQIYTKKGAATLVTPKWPVDLTNRIVCRPSGTLLDRKCPCNTWSISSAFECSSNCISFCSCNISQHRLSDRVTYAGVSRFEWHRRHMQFTMHAVEIRDFRVRASWLGLLPRKFSLWPNIRAILWSFKGLVTEGSDS